MSDRLALSNAIEDAGIPRDKAERVASVIIDAIHDNVATKADVAAVKADVAAVGADVRTARGEMATKTDLAALRGEVTLIEHRLLTRLGGLMIVVGGAVVAALRIWPPHIS